MLVLTIKQGKEKSLLQRQPWIYASAVEQIDGKPHERRQPGALALVRSSSGKFLAKAAHSPAAQIRARVWTFDEQQPVDHALIKNRVRTAIAAQRNRHQPSHTPADNLQRLISAEKDGLPGLVVDWWGAPDGFLLCQFQSAGVDTWKVPIVQALIAETGCPNVYEYCDPLLRKGEGLPVVSGALAGDTPPDDALLVTENGVRYNLELSTGKKTRLG